MVPEGCGGLGAAVGLVVRSVSLSAGVGPNVCIPVAWLAVGISDDGVAELGVDGGVGVGVGGGIGGVGVGGGIGAGVGGGIGAGVGGENGAEVG